MPSVVIGRNQQRFPRVLNVVDFGHTVGDATTCQPGIYTKVGTYTVKPQQIATFGANDVINGGITGTVLYILLADSAATALNGKVRLSLVDANELNETVILEERTERLSADKTDRNKGYLMREYSQKYAGQDSKLLIKFYPDSATAVTVSAQSTSSIFLVPTTIIQ